MFWNRQTNLSVRTRARPGHIHAFPRELPPISESMIMRLASAISRFPISVRADEHARHDEVALILINMCEPGKLVPAWVRLLVPCYGLIAIDTH
jgi:hypothetical protein